MLCFACGFTTTELLNVLMPPSFEIDFVLTYDVVLGALWTTFVPVSRFYPFPANVIPVNSALAPSPFNTLIG